MTHKNDHGGSSHQKMNLGEHVCLQDDLARVHEVATRRYLEAKQVYGEHNHLVSRLRMVVNRSADACHAALLLKRLEHPYALDFPRNRERPLAVTHGPTGVCGSVTTCDRT